MTGELTSDFLDHLKKRAVLAKIGFTMPTENSSTIKSVRSVWELVSSSEEGSIYQTPN